MERHGLARWAGMNIRHQPADQILHEQKRHDEPVEHLRGGAVLQTMGHECPCGRWSIRAVTRALRMAPVHHGCCDRVEACDIGLTGPPLRSPASGLLPGTGNAYPRIVLMTQ